MSLGQGMSVVWVSQAGCRGGGGGSLFRAGHVYCVSQAGYRDLLGLGMGGGGGL